MASAFVFGQWSRSRSLLLSISIPRLWRLKVAWQISATIDRRRYSRGLPLKLAISSWRRPLIAETSLDGRVSLELEYWYASSHLTTTSGSPRLRCLARLHHQGPRRDAGVQWAMARRAVLAEQGIASHGMWPHSTTRWREPSALSNAPDARDSILRLQCQCAPSTAAVDPTAKRERVGGRKRSLQEGKPFPAVSRPRLQKCNCSVMGSPKGPLRNSLETLLTLLEALLLQSFENREPPGTDPTHRNLPEAHSRVRLACSVDFFFPAHLGDAMVQRHAVFLQLDAFLPSGGEGSVLVVGISGGWASTHRSPSFRDPSLWQASIEHARDFVLRARWSGLGSDHHPVQ
ncbi:hypothetical protein CMUS01_05792 [Colletotrichum musicola]|uniref:Uncharacterized protein n=1 Tax=Colletotrichum musicola TaxID=2175873 RepID=A0A8H6KPN0_9PEZI|nr:hypothetical protein CMUS01_05792 [Colletotrichum musicola]